MQYISNLNAASKIAYDKTVEYMLYYSGFSKSNGLPDNFDECDKISDYDSCLDIDRYSCENENKRIYSQINFSKMWNWAFDNPSYIIDNLYIGSAFNAASFDILKSHNIKLIINVTAEIRNYFPDDFLYEKLPIFDDNVESIEKYLDDTYRIITEFQKDSKNEKKNILIHCFMGSSRSASIIINYLMKKYSWDFDTSISYMKSKREIVNPTFRYVKDIINHSLDRNNSESS